MSKQSNSIQDNWRRDELLLVFDSFFKDPFLKNTKIQEELLDDLKHLNLYISRWEPMHHKSSDSVLQKLTDCSRWNLNKEMSKELEYLFFQAFKADLEKFTNLAQAIRVFINHNLIVSTNLGNIDSAFEGFSKEVMHFRRERDSKIVRAKKQRVLLEKGRLECEACDFNFAQKYGDRGHNFAEVHHTKPISECGGGRVTFLDDLIILCSNCHRIIHRKKPWITIPELKKIIKLRKAS